jgi:3-hydroxyisobutyrate dehydrogenase
MLWPVTAMWNPHLASDMESMLSGNFETHFAIGLLVKDFGYTVKTAGGDASVPTVSAARRVLQMGIDEKLGDLNMTAVVKLFDKERVKVRCEAASEDSGWCEFALVE